MRFKSSTPRCVCFASDNRGASRADASAVACMLGSTLA